MTPCWRTKLDCSRIQAHKSATASHISRVIRGRRWGRCEKQSPEARSAPLAGQAMARGTSIVKQWHAEHVNSSIWTRSRKGEPY
jgi:hypothetical protein